VGCDLDGDGDIDYVATNFGENTRYHPTSNHPLVLYYGDVDGSGNSSLVEAVYENGTLVPMRDKYAIEGAMPLLAEQFSTHREYAEAALNEIFTSERLENALRFEVRTLQSSVLLNDGAGRFTVRPLPRFAQIAPGFGAELCDWNADGIPDLLIVGNFATPHVSAGPMNGGLGLLLTGDGEGGFSPVPPHVSGIVVPDDARSLARGDFDGDGRWSFVVGINNGRPMCFQSAPTSVGPRASELRISFDGGAGNRTAIGAVVAAFTQGQRRQTVEIYAGHGYLSQSSPVVEFTLPVGARWDRLEVQWPDGSGSTHPLSDETVADGQITIVRPRDE
jgi:hypothetical protein